MSTPNNAVAATRRGLKTHEVVAEELRRRIVRRELEPGHRLPAEEELTASFGIARTTLREALRVLEYEGLIEIRRGRGGGPVVTHPSVEPAARALAVTLQLRGTTVADLDEARRMIEPQVAARLALEHTSEDLAALHAAIDDAASAAETNDLDQFGVAAANVHETLMQRSGNETLATISQLLHEVVSDYYARAMAKTNQRSMRRAVRSYRKFAELIECGDSDGAAAHWMAQMSYTIGGHDRDERIDLYSTDPAAQ